jgi:phage-related protein
MTSVGPGVYEIRIRTRVEHRVFYVAKFAEGVYVLHAFEKRTKRTPKCHIDLAKGRFSQLIRERRSR